MAKISKKRKQILSRVDQSKSYNLAEASKIVKDITTTKFDASVDLSIRLGVDPRKANQMVRGVVTLPHGTGNRGPICRWPEGVSENQRLRSAINFHSRCRRPLTTFRGSVLGKE